MSIQGQGTSVWWALSSVSAVYAAALDVSKAYDCVQNFKLFTALLHAGISRNVVYLLADWSSKLFIVVRWNDAFSIPFKISSGVRKGSSLKPSLLNVFTNKVIMDLKRLHLSCYVNKTCIGCVLHADDMILLFASLSSLQTMLNRVCSTVCELNLNITCSKLTCIAFGPHHKVNATRKSIFTVVKKC